MQIDMFEMCTPELQQKLIPMREAIKAEEDRELEAVTQVKPLYCRSSLMGRVLLEPNSLGCKWSPVNYTRSFAGETDFVPTIVARVA